MITKKDDFFGNVNKLSMRCGHCESIINIDDYWKYCGKCVSKLLNETGSLKFDLYELMRDKTPKQLNTNEIIDKFNILEKKMDELIDWVKAKRQQKYDKERWHLRLNKKERNFILERDNYTCKNCGKVYDKSNLHVDHIIPRKDGGGKEPSNLQTLCLNCNMIKSSHRFDKLKENEDA